MKKIIAFIMGMAACGVSAVEYEYMPLVQEGKVWEYRALENDDRKKSDSIFIMEFRGDTLINDTTFKKLYFYDTKTLASPQWPLAYMCEIDKKVYARTNSALCEELQRCPYNMFMVAWNYESTTLIYDFNNMANQKIGGVPSSVTPVLSQVEIDGKMRNKGTWASDDGSYSVELIEGVGPNVTWMTLVKPSIFLKIVNGKVNLHGLKCVKNSRGEIIFKGRSYTAKNGSAGVTEIAQPKTSDNTVYTIDGRVVRTNATGVDGLDSGVYIYSGKKIVVR